MIVIKELWDKKNELLMGYVLLNRTHDLTLTKRML